MYELVLEGITPKRRKALIDTLLQVASIPGSCKALVMNVRLLGSCEGNKQLFAFGGSSISLTYDIQMIRALKVWLNDCCLTWNLEPTAAAAPPFTLALWGIESPSLKMKDQSVSANSARSMSCGQLLENVCWSGERGKDGSSHCCGLWLSRWLLRAHVGLRGHKVGDEIWGMR